MNADVRYWALVPAAGVGRRMGADTPKQYLTLLGKSVIEHTLSRLLEHKKITGICVALSNGDPYWPALPVASDARIISAQGGDRRCDSVLNGLNRLIELAGKDDWVLVHDAARPCLRKSDIDRLIEETETNDVGGLLAIPVHDTVKQASSAEPALIEATVPRDQLWRAFTPQIFRIEQLRSALDKAISQGSPVTDEASAMELAGYRPRLVEGSADNIKITCPEDLALAEYYLSRQL